jgi:hypothetical protein
LFFPLFDRRFAPPPPKKTTYKELSIVGKRKS